MCLFMKSFLKYPGGKSKIVGHINSCLKSGEKLIEPFVGAGNVFINTDFDRYLLNDINRDVIEVFKYLKKEKDSFIAYCEQFFSGPFNSEDRYYELRDIFNELDYSKERAALFLYLNRHGYNGLCRYNKKGQYNVPFGRYSSPYFPEQEMLFFSSKLKRAEFMCDDFGQAFRRARKGDVIYADPPYFQLPGKKSFTAYSGKAFNMSDQVKLATLSAKARARGIKVVISNHDVPDSRKIYSDADIVELKVRRTISCAERDEASELLAIYS